MATLTQSFIQAANNDAQYRVFAKFISDTFTLSFSNVFSNIDFLTVTRPTATVVAGKEIWSSNDAGGGLNNFFVLVEYSMHTSSTFAVFVTVGWSHDGAGNLTGVTSLRRAMSGATFGSAIGNNWGSADTGRVRILISTTATNVPWYIGIERLRENGALVNKINFCNLSGQVGTCQYESLKSGYAYLPTTTTSEFPPMSITLTNIQESFVGLGYLYPAVNGWGNKLRNFMLVPAGQLGAPEGQVTINIGGVNHNYLITHVNTGNHPITNTVYNGLMLYQ